MTTQDGVVGRLFTATNGNTLFLPSAGYQQHDSNDCLGRDGEYWSNSLYTDYGPNHPDYGSEAIYFWFTARDRDPNYNFTPTRRCYGLSVRAVRAVRAN